MARLRIGRSASFGATVFAAVLLLAMTAAARPTNIVTLRGRVLLPDGKPAAGAHVAVIGNRKGRARRGDSTGGRGPLAEATSDENGDYALRLNDVSEETHTAGRLIARQDGFAIAWREIDFATAETQADFQLKPDEPLHLKLIDIEGQPAAGLRLSIITVVVRSDGEPYPQGVHYAASDQAPAAWIAPVTADEDGKLVVYGLAADQGASLSVQGDDRFARQDIDLNTGRPEERVGIAVAQRRRKIGQTKVAPAEQGSAGEKLRVPHAEREDYGGLTDRNAK
jgi:hypothetical protein